MAALVAGYIVILSTPPPHMGIRGAHMGDLGGLAVIAGLMVTIHEEMTGYHRAGEPHSPRPGVTDEHAHLLAPEHPLD